jgi:hypothetical protein
LLLALEFVGAHGDELGAAGVEFPHLPGAWVGGGASAMTKSTSSLASRRSVLANWRRLLAKARTYSGLTRLAA